MQSFEKLENKKQNDKLSTAKQVGIWSLTLNYIQEDIKKRPRSFKIGFFTVFLVVAFLTLLTNIISLSPVVFIRTSENTVGDADIILTPVAAINDTRFQEENFTVNPLSAIRLVQVNEIDDFLKDHEDIIGITPRWYLFAKLSNPETKLRNISTVIAMTDPIRERSIGIGRNFDYPPLEEMEAYITESAVRFLKMYDEKLPKLIKGQKINFDIDFLEALSFGGNIAFMNPESGSNDNGDGDKEDRLVTDIPSIINQTIVSFLPQENITIWNPQIQQSVLTLLNNISNTLDNLDGMNNIQLKMARKEFIFQIEDLLKQNNITIPENVNLDELLPQLNSSNINQAKLGHFID